MRAKRGWAWGLAWGCLLSASASAQPHSAAVSRPDAPDHAQPFLPAPAESVADLVREVQQDSRARVRYAQFFHIAPQAVPDYLQRNLTPGILPGPDTFTAYFVSQYGPTYPVWLSLPAGARVFVTRDGVPALLCSTGDPLRPTLKPELPQPPLRISDSPASHP